MLPNRNEIKIQYIVHFRPYGGRKTQRNVYDNEEDAKDFVERFVEAGGNARYIGAFRKDERGDLIVA